MADTFHEQEDKIGPENIKEPCNEMLGQFKSTY